MGRNRRFAAQQAEPDEPDVEARITIARDDLSAIRPQIMDLWEHLYAPNVRHREKAEQERKPQVHVDGHANWTAQTKIQRVYIDVTAFVARAHDELGQNTDVPEFWTHAGDVCQPGGPGLTGSRALTVDIRVLAYWLGVLDESLAWVQTQDELLAPEINAVLHACDHIAAARERIEKLWPKDNRRRCEEEGCLGADGRPRPLVSSDGKVCRACRKRKERARKKELQERQEDMAEQRRSAHEAA